MVRKVYIEYVAVEVRSINVNKHVLIGVAGYCEVFWLKITVVVIVGWGI